MTLTQAGRYDGTAPLELGPYPWPRVLVWHPDTLTVDGREDDVELHPCGCPSSVVTSVLRGWREQCSRCGATFDSPDPL